jgi:hypothetical protein
MSSAPKTISILGGGHSARHYDRARLPGLVIGVNDAAILAPCAIAVSMDRLWTEARWTQLESLAVPTFIRRSAIKNVGSRPPWLTIFENDHASVDMTDAAGALNGTNSGVCAINLAYQRRPERVILWAFDMNRDERGRAYWFDDYPWAKPGGATGNARYAAWAAEFAIIARQFDAEGIEVLNASPGSAISAFPKVKPEELLA